jgi:Zn-dependent peptidase ImmA (M78 family)
MSQETPQGKKPRKVAAKKGVTKKSAEMRLVEETLVPVIAATSAPIKASKAKPRAKAKSLQVSIEDIIRLRAYEIYLRRGATPGNPHEDWQLAEREVRAHFDQQPDA